MIYLSTLGVALYCDPRYKSGYPDIIIKDRYGSILDYIFGPVVFAGIDCDKFRSLTINEKDNVLRWIKQSEVK